MVHLVAVTRESPSLARDDDSVWSSFAKRSFGLAWSAGSSLSPSDAQEMSRVYEELAHPLRVDHLTVAAARSQDDLGVPDSLLPGEGFASFSVEEHAARVREVTYELWGRTLHATALPSDGDADRIWSGLAAAEPPRGADLTDAERAELGWRGAVVSPATSLVCAPPGKRSVSDPGDVGDVGFTGIGGIGRIGHSTHVGPPGIPSSFLETLERMLRAALPACGIFGASPTVQIETTREEIVDVPSVEGAADPAQEACVREAAWSLILPNDFARVGRHLWFVRP